MRSRKTERSDRTKLWITLNNQSLLKNLNRGAEGPPGVGTRCSIKRDAYMEAEREIRHLQILNLESRKENSRPVPDHYKRD